MSKRTRLSESSQILNIFKKPMYDESVTKRDYHTYLPYTSNVNYSDTIRIEIQSSDLITATYDSYIKINGTFAPLIQDKPFKITHNAVCFLFDEIQLKLGSNQIIDICRKPAVTSMLKGFCSYSEKDSNGLSITGWKPIAENEDKIFKDGVFSCAIPLKYLFGFCEDYTREIVKMRQELILIRSKSDVNCYSSSETDVKFTISKISWEIPHISLNDEIKLSLFDKLRLNPDIVMPFRQYELHELPAIGTAKSNVWRIKNSNELEKPRWILVALQDNKYDVRDASACEITHSNLVNIRAYLNSEMFPYQRMNLDFAANDYMTAFINYKNFRSNYYGKSSDECLFDYAAFKQNPVFVIDCTEQSQSLKDSPVDIRLEIDSDVNFTPTTKVYCLIIHDTIIQYNPFTETVSRMIKD